MESTYWKLIENVRQQAPLVQSITNYVVMNNTANALLAAGASPIMAHAHKELHEMVSLCQALVINIGTLDDYWYTAMINAAKHAHQTKTPWVLDPVGAGATSYRDELVSELLAYAPTVIRGNASEIMAVAKASTAKTKGVDSTAASTEAIDAARYLQQTYGCVVCISGATDIIVSGNGILYLHNGDALMTKITGMGCTATALIAAFLVVTPNVTDAVAAAMSLLAISGELSAKESKGPGSLQLNILDMLHTITKAQFKATVRYETA